MGCAVIGTDKLTVGEVDEIELAEGFFDFTEKEEIVFNEVNTIPGFTAHSRFPNMMKAAGISFEEVISAILRETLERK